MAFASSKFPHALEQLLEVPLTLARRVMGGLFHMSVYLLAKMKWMCSIKIGVAKNIEARKRNL